MGALSCDLAVVPTVLEVDDLKVWRAPDFAVALPRLVLAAGEAVGLCAPSGAGKSSLLLALTGLAPHGLSVQGRIRWLGRDTDTMGPEQLRQLRRQSLALVLQDAVAALDPLQPVGRQLQQATGCDVEQGCAALRELGIQSPERIWRSHPHALSGGEAQRVLLSVPLLRRPAVVIADEPSSSLDVQSRARLLGVLQQLRARGAALLLASHDQELLQSLGARVFGLGPDGFREHAAATVAWPRRRSAALGEPVLTARGLCVQLGGRNVLDQADLVLRRGEVVALTGPSGAGKTTLAKVLAGHLIPQQGSVARPPRRTAVQLLCQDAFASLTPGRTLGSLLAEATAPAVDLAALLRALQLPASLLGKTAAQLSGGERRRAALLRALAMSPEALLLDEPTASLDRASALAVMQMVLQWCDQTGLALLVVTHDRELAHAVADRVLDMRGGKPCE